MHAHSWHGQPVGINSNVHLLIPLLKPGSHTANILAGLPPTPNMSWEIEAFSLCVIFTKAPSGPPWDKRALALGSSQEQCA